MEKSAGMATQKSKEQSRNNSGILHLEMYFSALKQHTKLPVKCTVHMYRRLDHTK